MWVFDNNCFHTSALFRKTLLAHFSRKFFRWFIPSLRSMSWKGVPLKMHEYFSFENILHGTLCWDPYKQKEKLWSFPRIPFYAFLCLRPDWRRGNLEKAHWCHRATNRDFWPSCCCWTEYLDWVDTRLLQALKPGSGIEALTLSWRVFEWGGGGLTMTPCLLLLWGVRSAYFQPPAWELLGAS